MYTVNIQSIIGFNTEQEQFARSALQKFETKFRFVKTNNNQFYLRSCPTI
jgi:hypothetical protein